MGESIRFHIRYFLDFSSSLYVHEKSFFYEKSIIVSSFCLDSDINIWRIIIYKNDTFLIPLQEVSSKYHKTDRSIMKSARYYHQIIQKASRNRHKALCIIAKSLIRNKCPKIVENFGHSVPIVWAMSAHSMVCQCPTLGL